jgi:N utilization substance protein A
VEIKSVAREAGSRSKIAVIANQDGIDPIGACVGQKGSRVQTVMAELGGEKIDIIQYDEDAVKFIANSLSPAKILSVQLNEESKEAKVEVLEDQLSLAIGKAGATNAGLMAVAILSLQDKTLAAKLKSFRKNQSSKVLKHKKIK